MKSSRLMISVAFVLFVLVATALAQSPGIRVTVPFDFAVGRQTLTAGDYRVSLDTAGMLRVKRVDSTGSAATLTHLIGGNPNGDPAPQMIFNRYGKHHFLAKVWTVNRGAELYASPEELELARTTRQEHITAMATPTPER